MTANLPDPMIPTPFVVQKVKRETADTYTLDLTRPAAPANFAFAPGQFNMLYAFGAGEVPISISGDPARPGTLVHTVRDVGNVTRAICRLKRGDVLGVRGPFGVPWPVDRVAGEDVLIIAGGLGLAPLRPALYHLLNHRGEFGNIEVIYGARTPKDLLYPRELERWRGRFDLRVHVTVDAGGRRLAQQRGGGDQDHRPGPVRSPQHRGPGLRPRGDDALHRAGTHEPRADAGADLRVHGAQHEMRHRPVRPLPVGAVLCLQGRPGVPL